MSGFLISSWDPFKTLKALQTMLQAWPRCIALELRVTRGEEVNESPDLAPWCGIYPLGDDFPIRTLGVGNGFRQQRQAIAIIVQNVSRTSGAECQDVLGQMQKAIVDCILSDTSIGGTMDIVDDFSVSYSAPAQQAKTTSFQSSVIKFTAAKAVGVSGG